MHEIHSIYSNVAKIFHAQTNGNRNLPFVFKIFQVSQYLVILKVF